MTGLIGGSLLLIIGSAIALFFGWITADPNLMWVSIGASGMSAVLLALGYGRSRAEIDRAVAIAMRREGLIPETEARPPQREPRPSVTKEPVAVPNIPEVPAVQPATGAMPALDADLDVDLDLGPQVVAIPSRKRYHRPECRYSTSKGAQTVSLAAARRRGYGPCGVCKP